MINLVNLKKVSKIKESLDISIVFFYFVIRQLLFKADKLNSTTFRIGLLLSTMFT